MSMYTKLTTAAAVAALAFGLAACGGGGGGDDAGAPPPTTTDPMPPAPEPVAVDLPMLPTGDMYALSAGEHEIAAGGTAENGGVMFACAAGGEACVVTVTADGMASSTGGDVTASLTSAAQMAYDDQKAAMMAENSGRSLGMHSALTDATGARGEAILGGTKDNDLVIMRGMSGGAMVTDGRLGGKSGWTSGMADRAVSGFEGHKLTRKTETIVVHTDIAAAKHKAFLTHYPDGTAVNIDATNTITPGTGSVLTLTAALMKAAGDAGLLDPTKFPQPKGEGEGNNTYTYDNMEGAGKKQSSFKGTFHGAPGTYNCATADCVVQVSDRSTSSAPEFVAAGTTGDWTFTPDTANNPQIVNQDGDHMHFGWWVNTPAAAAAEGQYLYDAEIFYGGSMPFAEAAINALDGDADYSGPAAGLFAVKGENAAHGEFTATATLTARFGDTTVPGSVSGKIGSFVRDDGVANDWALTLGAANILTTGTTPAGAGNGSGLVTGGSNDVIGAWTFQMYGPTTAAKDPTGIAGDFRAAIDANTAVAGAFATK